MSNLICGIDEAGRGPLAGSVYAASVILGDYKNEFLNDSKKLSAKKRESLKEQIKKNALAYGIGFATHEEIDNINILQASLLAMKRAYKNMIQELSKKTTHDFNIHVIIDGNNPPALPDSSYSFIEAIVKADTKIPEVMAASILAKTARDTYMEEMAKLYPEYGYDKHKGYPTEAHREAVKKYGPSPIQRMSFKIK